MGLGKVRDDLKSALDQGKPWGELAGLVAVWFAALKKWEAKDTFEKAYADQRMTGRNVNTNPLTMRGESWEIRNKQDPSVVRTFTLAKGIKGQKLRGDFKNFIPGPNGRNNKHALGLHDLSATLLDPGFDTISEQMKPYELCTTVFFPVPLQADLNVFYVLNDLAKGELKGTTAAADIREIKAQVSRIKLAQAVDMHTYWVDDSAPKAEHGKFRYGITGLLPAVAPAKIGKKVSQTEIDARKANAKKYQSILAKEGRTDEANEIVLAYRHHNNPIFPLFTTWDATDKRFVGTTNDDRAVVVTNDGKYTLLG